jgi:hypothetical protein
MKSDRRAALLALIVGAVGFGFASGMSPAAMRFVKFEIFTDGKAVLQTSTGDTGEPPDEVWSYLKTLAWKPVKGYQIKPDAGDPSRATLKGKLRLFAAYGGDASVERLTLVRGKEGKWTLDPKDVERTMKTRKKPK